MRFCYEMTAQFDFFKPLSITLIISFLCSCSLLGRIYEERTKLEIRLFRSGGLQIKDEKQINQKQRGMIYTRFTDFFPNSTEVRLYYKTVDGRRAKPSELENGIPEGWILHVVYYKGLSMIEVYQKSGAIDDYEKAFLMDFQRGQSFWTNDSEEDQEEKTNCFAYDFIRDDKKAKVKINGKSSLLFFSTDFDRALAEAKKKELEELAPDSIKGF
jgi:hypothetical protein